MLRAYKYRICPIDEQKVLFAKSFGCCRFVYNWALVLKITAYRERKETLGNVYLTNLLKVSLRRKMNGFRKSNPQSLLSTLRNLDTAYSNNIIKSLGELYRLPLRLEYPSNMKQE